MSERQVIEYSQPAFNEVVRSSDKSKWAVKFCDIGGRASDIVSLALNPAEYIYFAKLAAPDRQLLSFAVATIDSVERENDRIHLRQIQTNPDYLRQGHAISLIRAVFQKAVHHSMSLQFTPFEKNGKKLAEQIAVIHHQEFPRVQVHYSGQDQAISGDRAYCPQFGKLYFLTQKTGIEYI